MRLTDKTERWSMGNKTYKGRYKECECNIYYSQDSNNWYFLCANKDGTIRYNSLWSRHEYGSKKECHDACIAYIDARIKEMKGMEK